MKISVERVKRIPESSVDPNKWMTNIRIKLQSICPVAMDVAIYECARLIPWTEKSIRPLTYKGFCPNDYKRIGKKIAACVAKGEPLSTALVKQFCDEVRAVGVAVNRMAKKPFRFWIDCRSGGILLQLGVIDLWFFVHGGRLSLWFLFLGAGCFGLKHCPTCKSISRDFVKIRMKMEGDASDRGLAAEGATILALRIRCRGFDPCGIVTSKRLFFATVSVSPNHEHTTCNGLLRALFVD